MYSDHIYSVRSKPPFYAAANVFVWIPLEMWAVSVQMSSEVVETVVVTFELKLELIDKLWFKKNCHYKLIKIFLDATLCRFYFCRVSLLGPEALIRRCDGLPATITHVPVAAILVLNTPDDGRLRPKHVEWPCRNKTCTVLHQDGVLFDLHNIIFLECLNMWQITNVYKDFIPYDWTQDTHTTFWKQAVMLVV